MVRSGIGGCRDREATPRGQRVSATTFTTPAGRRGIGAVQAQDYLGALWGHRAAHDGCARSRDRARDRERRIIRTWPMRARSTSSSRPTARWMVELLAPKIAARAAGRLRSYGIDATLFAKRAARSCAARKVGGS